MTSKKGRPKRASETPSSSGEGLNGSMDEAQLVRKKKYKELIEAGAKLSERVENESAKNTLVQIRSMITTTNTMFEQSNQQNQDTATEKVMDASVLKIGHELIGNVVKCLGEQEFDSKAYVTAILRSIATADETPDWRLWLPHVNFRGFQIHQSALGSFRHDTVHERKEKKERVVREKKAQVQMKAAEKVDELKREEKGAKLINIVFEQIRDEFTKRGPIPYYELITDPSDFMASVDNAFQVSFLLREGSLGIRTNDEDSRNPLIYVVPDTQKAKSKSSVKTVQAVMSLSVQKWRECVESMGREEPIIKINRKEFWRDAEDRKSFTQKPSSSQMTQPATQSQSKRLRKS